MRRTVCAILLAMALAGCSSPVAGAPPQPTEPIATTTDVTAPPISTTQPTSAALSSPECTGRLSAGSLRMTGGPVRTVIANGAASFSCGAGPLVSLTLARSAMTFTDSGTPVTIANGSSATVGPYQITVLSIDHGTATFKIVAPS